MPSSDITKCSNSTCKLKEHCKRWTQESTPGVPQAVQHFKSKQKGLHTVCDMYWYNGVKFDKP